MVLIADDRARRADRLGRVSPVDVLPCPLSHADVVVTLDGRGG